MYNSVAQKKRLNLNVSLYKICVSKHKQLGKTIKYTRNRRKTFRFLVTFT